MYYVWFLVWSETASTNKHFFFFFLSLPSQTEFIRPACYLCANFETVIQRLTVWTRALLSTFLFLQAKFAYLHLSPRQHGVYSQHYQGFFLKFTLNASC